MATTLQNYGLPLAGGGGRGGMLQPKMKYKFRVRVFNFGPQSGGLELTQQVISCGRPTWTHEKIAIHSYNSVSFYAGKAMPGTIELVVRDDITNAVSRLVGHQEQKQMNHFEQTTAAAGANYKFNMLIETLDGGNDVVLESWEIEGCFLESIAYGEFNYSESEALTITMSVCYDNATQNGGLMTNAPEFTGGFTV